MRQARIQSARVQRTRRARRARRAHRAHRAAEAHPQARPPTFIRRTWSSVSRMSTTSMYSVIADSGFMSFSASLAAVPTVKKGTGKASEVPPGLEPVCRQLIPATPQRRRDPETNELIPTTADPPPSPPPSSPPNPPRTLPLPPLAPDLPAFSSAAAAWSDDPCRR